jgi:N-terminal domain of galactosyltransferase
MVDCSSFQGRCAVASLSVIIPWCDRPELLRTLAHNAACFAATGAEVIVGNCGGRRDTLPGELMALAGVALRWTDIPALGFNKGLALNLGASLSKRDALFFLDTDILIEPATLVELVGALNEESFVTVASVVESRALELRRPPSQIEAVTHMVEFRTAAGEIHRIVTNRLDLQHGARTGPGLALVWRRDFLAIGGMNGALTAWGWDDLDLIARLQMALGRQRREVGSVTHLSHSDRTRTIFGKDRGKSESRNFMACLAAYSAGDLRGTYDEDVAQAANGQRVIEL